MENSTETQSTQAKRVNFAPDLVPLVQSREKTSTWRIGDEKGIVKGDTLQLHMKGKLPDGTPVAEDTPFAMAEVVEVVAKPFRQFVAEDLAGHETFTSEAEMLDTYRRYYPEENVTLDTTVKIIRFELKDRGHI